MIPGRAVAAALAVSLTAGCGQISLVGLDRGARASNDGSMVVPDGGGADDLATVGGLATDGGTTVEAGCAGCAPQLVEGRLVDMAVASPTPGLRLVGQGFEAPAPSCAMVRGQRICLIGGIAP